MIAQGTRAQATKLEARVGRRIAAAGSPPDGLMFVCVHPAGDGFRITMVFRTAEAARAEVEGPLRVDAAAVAIELGTPTVAPVWSMAFPQPTAAAAEAVADEP